MNLHEGCQPVAYDTAIGPLGMIMHTPDCLLYEYGDRSRMSISRLRNPVETCGWCKHPMEMHNFDPGIMAGDWSAVPCAHCPDNTCDLVRIYDDSSIATLYDGNDCA